MGCLERTWIGLGLSTVVWVRGDGVLKLIWIGLGFRMVV